ncbi:MAG: family 20 glycosylhydrolase, partial [Akkermansia sp.]
MLKTFLSVLCLGASLSFATPSTSTQYPADGDNYAQFQVEQPPLLPMPQEVQWKGKCLALTGVSLQLPQMREKEGGRSYQHIALIRSELGKYLAAHNLSSNAKSGYPIVFKLGTLQLPEGAPDWQRQEAYSISISEQGCAITAEHVKGLFYGMQTLEQLLLRRGGVTTLPLCEITDYPDLQIRGFMNDVGRNFLPIELIKLELDAMARLKYNTYHFHLTDHYGWRLGSKLYPELNKAENHERSKGKYYTQREFIELVEYCRLRNITIIPELDMPGHSDAFRKALGISKMSDSKATEALVALIKELGSLVPVEDMPMIHIGTDEVRNNNERVNNATLNAYYQAVEDTDRRAIHWSPGLCTPEFNDKVIEQMWIGVERASARPRKGGDYIDSQDTYVNHTDPFECGPLHYFRRPCPYKDANGLGFILCSWPDIEITDARNHLRQTAVFPAMAFASQSIWNNPHEPLT